MKKALSNLYIALIMIFLYAPMLVMSAPDLRAGAALVIAGLAADGITIVDDIYYIERGYEAFDEKFRGIGGMMQKVSSEKEIQQFRLKL